MPCPPSTSAHHGFLWTSLPRRSLTSFWRRLLPRRLAPAGTSTTPGPSAGLTTFCPRSRPPGSALTSSRRPSGSPDSSIRRRVRPTRHASCSSSSKVKFTATVDRPCAARPDTLRDPPIRQVHAGGGLPRRQTLPSVHAADDGGLTVSRGGASRRHGAHGQVCLALAPDGLPRMRGACRLRWPCSPRTMCGRARRVA
jgi:hypothetical protein